MAKKFLNAAHANRRRNGNRTERFYWKRPIEYPLRIAQWRRRRIFKEKLTEIKETIESMPGPYGTEGQGIQMKAFLHYFAGASDWYIFERDNVENEPQLQAFGFACLNGDEQNAELGYINISEIIACNVELDLHYQPETLEEILKKHHQPLPVEDTEEEGQDDDGGDVPPVPVGSN